MSRVVLVGNDDDGMTPAAFDGCRVSWLTVSCRGEVSRRWCDWCVVGILTRFLVVSLADGALINGLDMKYLLVALSVGRPWTFFLTGSARFTSIMSNEPSAAQHTGEFSTPTS